MLSLCPVLVPSMVTLEGGSEAYGGMCGGGGGAVADALSGATSASFLFIVKVMTSDEERERKPLF